MCSPRQLCAYILLSIAGIGLASEALAQTPSSSSTEVKGAVGYAGFIDEVILDHLVVGASVRFRIAPRWSFEPWFLYMRRNDNNQLFYILPSVSYDLVTEGRAIPYLVYGAGVFWDRQSGLGPTGNVVFTSTDLTMSGGAGLRLRLGDRVLLTSEARMGTEPLFQFTGSLGYSF